MQTGIGAPLTEADYRALAARFVTPEIGDGAGLRRVSTFEGRELIGYKRGDMQGIAIPNIGPGSLHPRAWRLRRDHPDREQKSGSAELHEVNKYIGAPEARNMLYFPPGVSQEQLQNPGLPILMVEGEFKALAASRVPGLTPIGVSGVWNWRGMIGKTGGPNGERLDVKGVIPDFDKIAWTKRFVYIAFDADAARKPQVQAARAALSKELQGRGADVAILEWDEAKGKGCDDFLAANGIEAFQELLEQAQAQKGGWKSKLIVNDRGTPKALLANCLLALRHHPDWKGVLGYNEFALEVEILLPTPWNALPRATWNDNQDRLTTEWLQKNGLHVSVEIAAQAIQTVALERSFHPVRSYLNSLQWDGRPRIGTWLRDLLGVDDADYSRAVGERWLISAVARAFKPGSKVDHVLILEGDQGSGKSTALSTLGCPWFADEIADLGSKDASMQTRGVWIIEIAELDSMSRSEVGKIKAFISRTTDRFRPPYGRHVIQSPRQCVFVGSVNHSAYLRDETGARRFWPVQCHSINLKSLERDRDQLWAEATVLYREGKAWWLDSAELMVKAAGEQASRFEGDPWDEALNPWLDGRTDVSIGQILSSCLGKETQSWSQSDKNRVARALCSLGWERYKARLGSDREWRYRLVSKPL